MEQTTIVEWKFQPGTERGIVKKRFHLLKFFIFSTSNVRVEGAR